MRECGRRRPWPACRPLKERHTAVVLAARVPVAAGSTGGSAANRRLAQQQTAFRPVGWLGQWLSLGPAIGSFPSAGPCWVRKLPVGVVPAPRLSNERLLHPKELGVAWGGVACGFRPTQHWGENQNATSFENSPLSHHLPLSGECASAGFSQTVTWWAGWPALVATLGEVLQTVGGRVFAPGSVTIRAWQ